MLLGHDEPQYRIEETFLHDYKNKFWVHCKNLDALEFITTRSEELNGFWHQNDDVTITSLGYFWTFPGKQLTKNSIACMPEISEFDNIEQAFGICSDYIENYK